MTVNELIEVLSSLPAAWRNDQVICYHEVGSFLDTSKENMDISVDLFEDGAKDENNNLNESKESDENINNEINEDIENNKDNEEEMSEEDKKFSEYLDKLEEQVNKEINSLGLQDKINMDEFNRMFNKRFVLGPVQTVSRISINKIRKYKNIYELSKGAIIIE